MSIFISYSSKDKDFVIGLVNSLKARKVNVWFDEWEIRVGDSIVDKINTAIDQMNGIAVVLSKNSIRSNWVRKELNSALIRKLSDQQIAIFPLLLDDCKMPALLAEYRYADFRHDFDEGFSQFVSAIAGSESNSIPTRKAEKEEEPNVRFGRLHSECMEAFQKLKHELLLLSDIILEAWFEFSRDENGNIGIYRPSDEKVRPQVADFIIDRLIADPRSNHDGIENVRAAPARQRQALVREFLHFDKELFLRIPQPWVFRWNRYRLGLQPSDTFELLFNEIIPSQFIASMARFALNWISDMKSEEYDLFCEYLISKYGFKYEGIDLRELWRINWSYAEGALKSLVFFERVGVLSPRAFEDGGQSIAESYPLVSKAASTAFFKEGDLHRPLWTSST